MERSRRDFLKVSGLTLGAMALPIRGDAQPRWEAVSIIVDPADPVASSAPCRWAVKELSLALEERAVKVGQFASVEHALPNSFCIVASGVSGRSVAELLGESRKVIPNGPDFLALVPFSKNARRGVLACGDARGLMYALLELADRVQHSDDVVAALEQPEVITERPFNSIRSVGRIFCSDIQDKPWYNDREMWPAYFSMLATQRVNRFSLNFGIGYDFLDNVRDAYFLFTYPFLLSVPGYNVRAVNLPDEERDRNLEMLRFISSQAVAHGIDFQLGIWTHGYQWGPASKANYTIEGLTSDKHAAYSRDALTALLKACPEISGITLRTHGESGVREGSYGFWSTVFSGVPACGRTVNLDLHTKGLDHKLADAAVQTGMPVVLSPKYWAEHMGLPYQQTAIRELEMPRGGKEQDFFALSAGARSFTRYGYADFLNEDRQYRVIYRIWPGTHRLLLWGDPTSTAAYARAFNFCGSDGAELFEPLSFKGRRGSGIAGSRCAYADASLEPRWDWQKYLYTYRAWGRLTYNPEAKPDTWQRYLRKQFRAAAPAIEAALASASGITPLITTAHLPSAANEGFDPEYYTNQSIVDKTSPSPYDDTPKPKVFGNVSPLDPEVFSTINEFVAEVVKKERSGKYSPLEVAQWLDAAANTAASQVRDAEARSVDKNSAEFRRALIDLKITVGIGQFFAAKMRSGVLYAAYEQAGDRAALEEAVKQYRRARDIWRGFAEGAKGAYVSDITFGTEQKQGGNWLDRLPAIEEDVAAMEKVLQSAPAAAGDSALVHKLSAPTKRGAVELRHVPAASFVPGEELGVSVAVPGKTARVRLHYRHVNQAETYQATEMQKKGGQFTATIPADYTKTSYPLQYYFEVHDASGAWLYPGLGARLQDQPYFVVRVAGVTKG